MAAIEAVVVNHNTSSFTELCLRSLFATHLETLDIAVTVMDNQSQDDTSALRAYTADQTIPFVQTGFTTESVNNTHGEVLRAFVLSHPDPQYYLLLDTDICFLQTDTLLTMQNELDADPNLFAMQPRMTVNGIDELPGSGWQINIGSPIDLQASIAGQPTETFHGLLQPRCHPGCALIKNSPAFRRVVEHIGFSTAWLFGETLPMRGFYDTFALLCLVMKTHELGYALSTTLVQHLFSVSYNDEAIDWKQRVVNEKLALLRAP